MIWILGFFTLFFGLSTLMNALDDNVRGFFVHGAIFFVLLIVTIVYVFYKIYHP